VQEFKIREMQEAMPILCNFVIDQRRGNLFLSTWNVEQKIPEQWEINDNKRTSTNFFAPTEYR